MSRNVFYLTIVSNPKIVYVQITKQYCIHLESKCYTLLHCTSSIGNEFIYYMLIQLMVYNFFYVVLFWNIFRYRNEMFSKERSAKQKGKLL